MPAPRDVIEALVSPHRKTADGRNALELARAKKPLLVVRALEAR